MVRIWNLLVSSLILMKYKLLYGSSFNFSASTRVGRNFRIRLSNGGRVRLGKRVLVRDNVILHCTGGYIDIHDDVFINDNTLISSRESVVIKERTIIGQNVLFYDHDHDYQSDSVRDNYLVEPICVDSDVWIGSQACILRGTSIGKSCVVGAQTLVKGNIPSNSVYYQKKEKIMRDICNDSRKK